MESRPAAAEAEPAVNFEGPEKVLEVWFSDNKCKNNGVKVPAKGLREIKRSVWEDMLSMVKCQILSTIGNQHLDAYLLSESSMFVYPRQLVLKTCGTTTLLNAIPKLLDIAASVGLRVEDVFYNRQNFFFPEKQLFPHRSFVSEVKELDKYFKNGAAYIVGKLNGNHWNFYNAEKKQNTQNQVLDEDMTFELLMTGLDTRSTAPFFYDSKSTFRKATEESGIDKFFPGAKIDDYVFKPYGYSMNGLMGKGYFTIHVTPQQNCSFASFESNIVLQDYTSNVIKVLECFNPSQFIMTLMGNRASMSKLIRNESDSHSKPGLNLEEICKKGFSVQDDIFLKFEHYDLVFLQMTRKETAKR